MTEQEKLSSQAEIKRKLTETNALITEDEIQQLLIHLNQAVMTPVTESVYQNESAGHRKTEERRYTFRLKDIGIFIDEESRQKFLIYLLDTAGSKHFTQMRWTLPQGKLDMTIRSVSVGQAIHVEDATLTPFIRIWEFKSPGQFLTKDDNKSVDDFAQALPLLKSFADLN